MIIDARDRFTRKAKLSQAKLPPTTNELHQQLPKAKEALALAMKATTSWDEWLMIPERFHYLELKTRHDYVCGCDFLDRSYINGKQ
jgi:hypothetical protein